MGMIWREDGKRDDGGEGESEYMDQPLSAGIIINASLYSRNVRAVRVVVVMSVAQQVPLVVADRRDAVAAAIVAVDAVLLQDLLQQHVAVDVDVCGIEWNVTDIWHSYVLFGIHILITSMQLTVKTEDILVKWNTLDS